MNNTVGLHRHWSGCNFALVFFSIDIKDTYVFHLFLICINEPLNFFNLLWSIVMHIDINVNITIDHLKENIDISIAPVYDVCLFSFIALLIFSLPFFKKKKIVMNTLMTMCVLWFLTLYLFKKLQPKKSLNWYCHINLKILSIIYNSQVLFS